MVKEQTVRLCTDAAVRISSLGVRFFTPISTNPDDPDYDDLGLMHDPFGGSFVLATEEVKTFLHHWLLYPDQPEEVPTTNPFEEAIGAVVTLKRGQSTHVGTLQPHPHPGGNRWQVSYDVPVERGIPVHILFTDCQVTSVEWDQEHDRPLIKVCPF